MREQLSEVADRVVVPVLRAIPESLREIIGRAMERDLFLLSAGLAFYALVSVAPMVVVALWVTSLIAGEGRIQYAAEVISRFAPDQLGLDQALNAVAQAGTGLGIVALLTGLWPASAYGSGLVRAFDRMGPDEDPTLLGLWGRGLALVVLLPLFVLGSLVGSSIGIGVLSSRPALGWPLAFATGLIAAIVGTGLLFRLFTPHSFGWWESGKAALWSGAGISALSLGFMIYVRVLANFEQFYFMSGLVAVVVLGLWLFLANAVMLLAYSSVLES